MQIKIFATVKKNESGSQCDQNESHCAPEKEIEKDIDIELEKRKKIAAFS